MFFSNEDDFSYSYLRSLCYVEYLEIFGTYYAASCVEMLRKGRKVFVKRNSIPNITPVLN
jgi:hypothetical protein